MQPRILIIDDEADICKALEFLLAREGYQITSAASGEEGISRLEQKRFDLVITDLKMGKVDGLRVLKRARALAADMPVVIMTAFGTIESAVDAMKQGAAEYIIKPFLNEEIKLTVQRVLEQRSIANENRALRQQISQRMDCSEFVANAESMIRIVGTLEKVIPTKSNILLLGESGTGKGLLAELIHCNSPRRDKPFISINCSAIPEGLLESELFGYKKGAFTGAVADKLGLIPLAHQGTLFLDEIGDMPTALQAKILKVIETGEVHPLGDTRPRLVDVRIVSATNTDLETNIKNGKFREDLYWRLNVIEIKVPPLRERPEDIAMMAKHFVRTFAEEHQKSIAGIDPEALAVLMEYRWPGNVRELKNTIERAVVMSEGQSITIRDLPDKMAAAHIDAQSCSSLKISLNNYEHHLLQSAFKAQGFDKESTAQTLGIDLATLYRKLKKYGIQDE
ncbi:MAG TPA: sigma-54 dependent transcriptional regulator [Dissulfurispiraceae bacterium]|nr:sigma-54 dependent transcriptional regulator [Dissulfurispiraceae bacterium]